MTDLQEVFAPPQDRYPGLLELFVRLCETPSPTGGERAVADLVASELGGIGLEVEEDATGAGTGSDAGNLLARIPGPEGAPTILLCAHLDTVPLDGPVEVERSDGVFTNKHQAILGADNKAAVAVILEAARELRRSSPVGIELVFTTSEEAGLLGAKELDAGALRASFGFVFDHATPIGEVVVAAPSYYRIQGRFHGKAAHAGLRPEDGHNAIVAASRAIAALELGRHDVETTSNVGVIEGGTAANVVAERCRVELEARSLDEAKAIERVRQIVDALTEAASHGGCDVETDVEQEFRAYRLQRASPAVEAAAAGLAAAGIEPSFIASGGGSDAHVFTSRGIPTVNVANGTERNHEPTEAVSVWALETMLDVVLGIARASTGTGSAGAGTVGP